MLFLGWLNCKACKQSFCVQAKENKANFMASEEQLAVSEKVKQVHLWLRIRSQEVGWQQAWNEHLERKDVLQDYAEAMKNLAEQYWAVNNQDERKSYCRIEWVRKTIIDYFYNGIREKQILRENRRLKLDDMAVEEVSGRLLKLFDVGSCYNPFKSFDFCDTYAIDLCPASSDVKKCNFLDVRLSDDNSSPLWYSEHVEEIPKDFFDIVVFCLFLEYLPGPEQRLTSCKTAWKSLKNDGLLIIITPDSNHQSANSSLMKSWKLALAEIGFIRFRIEKLKYLYCMAFRKTRHVDRYHSTENVPEILIPQDSVDYESMKPSKTSSVDNLPEECALNVDIKP